MAIRPDELRLELLQFNQLLALQDRTDRMLKQFIDPRRNDEAIPITFSATPDPTVLEIYQAVYTKLGWSLHLTHAQPGQAMIAMFRRATTTAPP